MRPLSPLLRKFLTVYFAAFVIALAVTIASQKLWRESIPKEAIQSLWLVIFAGYGPVIWASVREGEISVPPQIVLRFDRPFFFWMIVATHVVYWVAGTVIMAYSLLS